MPGGPVEDLKFDLILFSHVEPDRHGRRAVWPESQAFLQAVHDARVRYFDANEVDLARAWRKELELMPESRKKHGIRHGHEEKNRRPSAG